jgi:anhydro-N-acetylmuramic acid kinase
VRIAEREQNETGERLSPIERYRSFTRPRVVGLMSGTSADGIDAVLVEISAQEQTLELIRSVSLSYPEALRQRLFALFEDRASVREAARMNVLIGELFAQAALRVIGSERVDLIASHGQTVAHLPNELPPSTLQLGEPAIIAARTGCVTVADFRPADMALGGQAAPLVPFFDAWLLGRGEVDRVAVNIGGMANLTWLPRQGDVLGWDTGPGNVLIDALAEIFTGQPMDPGGSLAATGNVLEPLLEELLRNPYFSQTGPKSTGREAFGRDLARSLSERGSAADLLRTAAALTAESLSRSIATVARGPLEVVVAGGGCYNLTLMAELKSRLGQARIRSFEEFGLPAQAREGAAFAVLGHETMWGRSGSLPSVTGAKRPAVLGKIVLPPL